MQHLTDKSAFLIRIMFAEPAIMNELIDGKESNYYSSLTVDQENCEIVLGKTRFSWWNSLIGAEKRISISEFAFKVIGALSNKANEEGNAKRISKGLLEDIADSLQREGRSNDIIDKLFLVGYLGVKTTWSCHTMNIKQGAGDNSPTTVNIRMNEEVKTFKLPGSGDPIFRISIGPKGIDYIGED